MTNNNWKYGLAANVVKERLDENGVLRHGTKKFVGGAKIYLCGKYWNSDSTKIDVIGLDRHHKYRVVRLETKYIENLRIDKVYKPKIFGLMNGDYTYWPESILVNDWWWSNTKEDKKQIENFIIMWNTYRLFKFV